MKTTLRRPQARLLPLALLAACAGTPPPISAVALPATVPAQWTATGTAAAAAADAGPIETQWWRDFGDPLLDECVARALEHNQDLRAAAARLQAAAEQSRIAGAALLPQLDVGVDGRRARQLFLGFPFGSGGAPSSTFTSYGLNLNLSWEIDLWGRLRAADAAAVAELQAQTADYEGALQSLVAQTCKAYFAAVEARQQLVLARATVATVGATTADVRERFERGVRPAIDTYQAETNLADAQANVALRERLLQTAVRQLEILMGRYPANVTASAEELLPDLPEVPAGLPSELLGRRPDLAAAERRLAASGCRVDEARAALYPRLSLTASGGTTSLELGDLIDDAFRVWSIGGNILQPLFRGGALRADLGRAEATERAAIADYGAAVLRAFAEVEIALADSAWLQQQQRAAALAAENAARARDLARDRYQQGIADFLAVNDGQRQAFQSQSAAIAVQRLRIDNRIDLILALGGGFAATPPRRLEEPARP